MSNESLRFVKPFLQRDHAALIDCLLYILPLDNTYIFQELLRCIPRRRRYQHEHLGSNKGFESLFHSRSATGDKLQEVFYTYAHKHISGTSDHTNAASVYLNRCSSRRTNLVSEILVQHLEGHHGISSSAGVN